MFQISKFDHIVASISLGYAAKVRDILLRHPLKSCLGISPSWHAGQAAKITCISELFSTGGADIALPARVQKSPTDLPSWTDHTTATFNEVKHGLANATLLVHIPPPVSAWLMPPTWLLVPSYIIGQWCLLSFFSWAVTPAGTSYST